MEFVEQCRIHKKNLDPLQTTQVKRAKKHADILPILALPAQNSTVQTKTTKITNPQPTAKRSNPVAPTVLKPEKSNREPSTLKKMRGSLSRVKIEKEDPDIVTDGTVPFDFSSIGSLSTAKFEKKDPDIVTDRTVPFYFPNTPIKKMRGSLSTAKCEKKDPDIVTDGTTPFDFSSIPTPICSCTGVSRQCYRWGAGGWQSSCCTTNISKYPLPMRPSKPPARMAGRKMSIGAYVKLLQRLAGEGHDLSSAVDLKNHWAKHGTNKFVTISVNKKGRTQCTRLLLKAGSGRGRW